MYDFKRYLKEKTEKKKNRCWYIDRNTLWVLYGGFESKYLRAHYACYTTFKRVI